MCICHLVSLPKALLPLPPLLLLLMHVCMLALLHAQVLSNPMHNWEHVPEAFCRQLRQPLCMALLRNCATPDTAAYSLALKLLMAILNLPR